MQSQTLAVTPSGQALWTCAKLGLSVSLLLSTRHHMLCCNCCPCYLPDTCHKHSRASQVHCTPPSGCAMTTPIKPAPQSYPSSVVVRCWPCSGCPCTPYPSPLLNQCTAHLSTPHLCFASALPTSLVKEISSGVSASGPGGSRTKNSTNMLVVMQRQAQGDRRWRPDVCSCVPNAVPCILPSTERCSPSCQP